MFTASMAGLLFILLFHPPATAAVIRVPGDFPTIQAGINAASDGDEVLVADGTYSGSGNYDLDFSGKRISLVSENGPAYTMIKCNGSYAFPRRGFDFHSGESAASVVAGFTVRDGFTSFYGGGISCTNGSSPCLADCFITSNSASSGAGIYCLDASSPALEQCVIQNNDADFFGGGCYFYGGSSPVVTDCRLNNNESFAGGGVYCHSSSSPVFSGCRVSGNSASTGGGIELTNSDPVFRTTIISGNYAAEDGGALYSYGGSALFENCLITGNSAYYDGGGFYIESYSDLDVLNCTFHGNSAGWNGGALLNDYFSSPSIINCILWNNAPEEIYIITGMPEVAYSDVLGGWDGEGNMDIDPRLVDYRWFEYMLHPASPCVDSGDPSINDSVYDTHPLWPGWYENGPRSDMGAYGGPTNADWLP